MAAEVEITGPLSERLVHKNWKARLAAYEELEKLFKEAEDGADRKFTEYGQLWKNIIGDNNAAAQDKGLDPLLIYLDRANEAPKQAATICPLLVEKALSQNKPSTKAKAMQALAMFVEIENPEPAISSLLKGCTNKVPKSAIACLACLKDIISQFGVKCIGPVKPIVSAFPSFFDHSDQGVRQEAQALVVELYKWLGQVIKTQMDKLRPAQVKDLEAAFETLPKDRPIPQRFPRSQEPTLALPQGQQKEESDGYDLLEAVDILSKIKSDWFENVASAKWSVRKEQLDALIELASAPKLQNGDYTEISKVLKKLMGDANVVVVSKAAKAIGLLGRGLRKDYSAHAKVLFPVLLDKFKEKKNTVVEEIHAALDFMYLNCFTLPDVIEDVVATANNKVPKVRQETLDWLTRCMAKSLAHRAAINKITKQLGGFLLTALDDSAPEVRDAACKTFGAIVGVVGERAMQGYLNKLDKIKLQKVKENFPQMAAPPPGSGKEEEPPADIIEEAPKEESKVPEKKSTKPSKGAAPPAKATAAAAGKGKAAQPAAAKKPGKAAAPEPAEPLPSTEDALEKAKTLFPEDLLPALGSAVWKARLQAVEDLTNLVEKMDDSLAESAGVIIRVLSHKPGWKESNVQVLSGIFSLIGKIAQRVQSFPKAASILVIPGILDKLSDPKVKNAGCECLTSFAEAHSPQFVFAQLYPLILNHKNPKSMVEGVTWMNTAMEEFGIASLDIKGLIDFAKASMEGKNPTVKTGCIKALGTLRKFVGPQLADFMTDIKPALLATIQDEFNKVANDTAPTPTRQFRDTVSAKQAGSSGELPREDISGSISSNILKQLGDANWKDRKEALDQVHQIIIGANKRIQSNLGGLMPALKARLADGNKNLVVSTLELLGLIASSMGPSVDKHSKVILSSMLNNFSDNKKNVRDATAASLDLWIKETGIEPFISLLPPVFENATARKDAVTWIVKHMNGPLPPKEKKLDFVSLVKPLLSCLEDKSSETRHGAETMLKHCIEYSGFDAVFRQCSDLKPASKRVVEPIVQGLRPAHQQASADSEDGPKAKKGAATKASKAAAKPAKPTGKGGAPSSTGSLFTKNDQKKVRVKKEAKIVWALEEFRPDLIEGIAEQMAPFMQEALHAKMFSTDFKKHVEALSELTSSLSQYVPEVIDNLDLLLKWMTIRMQDSNPAVLKKTLDLTQELFKALAGANYQLSDHEAAILFPFLVEKMGTNNETIKQTSHGLLKSSSTVYPASKIFKMVYDALKSKNGRTRLEALVELGDLIQRHGPTVGGNLAKIMPPIGEYLGSKDSNERNAAVTCIAKLHAALGANDAASEEIWKCLPSLTDAHKSLLIEKFRAPPPRPPTPTHQEESEGPSDHHEHDAGSGSSASPFTLDADKLDLPEVNLQELPTLAPISITTTFQAPTTVLSKTMEALQSRDQGAMIEAMKMLYLADDDNFVGNCDELIRALAVELRNAYATITAPGSMRLYKYILNALHKIFSKPTITKSVSQEPLGLLMKELVSTLAEDQTQIEDGPYILKAINLLMVTIMENADTTSCFSVFLLLLRTPNANPRFIELCMKCILRISKSLRNADVNVDVLLGDIHLFLESNAYAKKQKDDLPLRAVKTVISEIVSLKGKQIYNHLSRIPTNSPQQPAIIAYINLLLKSNGQPTQNANPSVPPLQQRLTEIFKKIGSKETTNEGLMELYRFKKENPTVDLQPHLNRTSAYFKDYIQTQLQEIEQRQTQAENRDPNTGLAPETDAYIARLRNLQTSKPEDVTSASLQSLRNMVKAAQAPLSSDPAAYVPAESASSTTSTTSTSTQSIDDLRQRLARIKNTFGTNTN